MEIIVKILTLPTLSTFKASSHTCIPRESNTSTHPKYFTAKVQVPDLKTPNCRRLGQKGNWESFTLRRLRLPTIDEAWNFLEPDPSVSGKSL